MMITRSDTKKPGLSPMIARACSSQPTADAVALPRLITMKTQDVIPGTMMRFMVRMGT